MVEGGLFGGGGLPLVCVHGVDLLVAVGMSPVGVGLSLQVTMFKLEFGACCCGFPWIFVIKLTTNFLINETGKAFASCFIKKYLSSNV